MSKFWKWIKNQADNKRILRIDGIIAEESWFDDEVSPKEFRAELESGEGDLILWLNSPGGDVFAASQIYTMLKEYPHEVDVKIDGMAASAGSVIAMAGDIVEMSPTSTIMIHDPTTIAVGNESEMQAALNMLKEVKESIINAYELKTKLPRERIAAMMAAETWFNAQKAVDLGFADKILYTDEEKIIEDAEEGLIFSRAAVTNSLLAKIRHKSFKPPATCRDTKHLYNHLNRLMEA